MHELRRTIFSRLIPNLREIGLMSSRVLPRYEKAGLLQYVNGASARQLTGEPMVAELDPAA